MVYVTVSSKGQIVLPAEQRRRLGLGAGAKVEILDDPDGVRLRVVRALPEVDVRSLAGMVTARSSGSPRKLEDFDPASIARNPG